MSTRDVRVLLVLWIAADVFFIILHVFYAFTPYLNHPFFNVEDDRSGGEAIQYAKEIWIAIAFLLIALRRR
jgi:TRAP-type mannitol/chloroaromatic compound transport system permease small subunit